MIKFSKIINQEKYVEKIQRLLRYYMNLYFIDPNSYFYTIEEKDNDEKCFYGDKLINFYDSDYNLNVEMIEYAAEIFGFDKDDLLRFNSQAMERWYEKYPFFLLFHEAENHWKRCNEGELIAKTAIEFYFKGIVQRKPRFDRESVEYRFYKKFDEIRCLIPEMNDWKKIKIDYVRTSVICDYDKAREMVSSFFDMVNDFKCLFNKALKDDLTADEIKQYNFLSTVLQIQDLKSSYTHILHYKDLKNCLEIYEEEGISSFEQIAKIGRRVDFSPYRFSGFTLDKELAQKYVDIFPDSKRQMREHANLVEYFEIGFSNVDSNNSSAFENHQKILINKYPEELQSEGYYAKRLLSFGISEKLGGLKVNSSRDYSLPKTKEIEKRIGKIRHSNFFEQRGIGIDWEN